MLRWLTSLKSFGITSRASREDVCPTNKEADLEDWSVLRISNLLPGLRDLRIRYQRPISQELVLLDLALLVPFSARRAVEDMIRSRWKRIPGSSACSVSARNLRMIRRVIILGIQQKDWETRQQILDGKVSMFVLLQTYDMLSAY